MSAEAPVACTLAEAERPRRAEMIEELGARALVGLEVEGARAVLKFDGDRAGVEDLVAAEGRCCAFFRFELATEGERTELRVTAPENAEFAVRGLVAGLVAGWGRLA